MASTTQVCKAARMGKQHSSWEEAASVSTHVANVFATSAHTASASRGACPGGAAVTADLSDRRLPDSYQSASW